MKIKINIKEVKEMSALVVGKGRRIGVIGDILLKSGFDTVHYQDSAYEIDLSGYGQLDMLVLMKEAVEERDIGWVGKLAIRLDVPLVIW